MTDDLPNDAKDLRDRVRGASEETIGRLAQELLSNPLVTGAVQRAMEIRERATQAQEAAFSALNVPSAADIERLTRRVRNVAQRLESIEDAVDRVDDTRHSIMDNIRDNPIPAAMVGLGLGWLFINGRRDDRDARPARRELPDLACCFPPVHHGHLAVHEHDVEVRGADRPHGKLAVVDDVHVAPGLGEPALSFVAERLREFCRTPVKRAMPERGRARQRATTNPLVAD